MLDYRRVIVDVVRRFLYPGSSSALGQGFRIVAYSGDRWIYLQGLRDGLMAIRESVPSR